MNILPKKSWHVRTKENIARVRRDEAKLAAEEKEQERRRKLAEGEARNAALRAKAKWKTGGERNEEEALKSEVPHRNSHINLFEDLEDGKVVSNATNAQYEKEKKEEKEKYEKQIGYLTYLGQDTVEATGNVSWYNKFPDRGSPENDVKESKQKSKLLEDPLTDIRRYLGFDVLKSLSKKKKEPANVVENKKRQRSSENSDSEDRGRNKRVKRTKKKSKKEKRKHRSKRRRRESSSSESEISAESADESQSNATVSTSKLEQLRAQRLKREQEEQKRTEALLARIRGEPDPEANKPNELTAVTQRYHSQFNPHLARQNKL